MVLARTQQFQDEQSLTHYDPVIILDAPRFNGAIRTGVPEAITNQVIVGGGFDFPDFFGSRPVQFAGRILCGQPFAITGQVTCNGEYAVVSDGRLLKLSEGGVSDIVQSFSQALVATVGNCTFQLVNGDGLVSDLIERSLIENTQVTISLGFLGGALTDYLTIFSGVVDTVSQVTPFSAVIELLDGSFRRHLEIPQALGGAVFPGVLQTNQGSVIPIAVGYVKRGVSIQVEGAASGVLAFELSAVEQEIFIEIQPEATFPSNGTVRIGNEEIAYGIRDNVIAQGKEVIRLSNALRGAGAAFHADGAPVTTVDERFTHLLSTEVRTIGLMRESGGGPVALEPNLELRYPGADRPVSVAIYETQQSELLFDVDGGNLSASLVSSGEDALTPFGWSVVFAELTAESHGVDNSMRLLKINPEFPGVAGVITQEITVADATRYVFSIYFSGSAATATSILVGKPGGLGEYVRAENLDNSQGEWQSRQFIFETNDTTLVITLRAVDGAGFFRAIRLRPAIDDNPARVLPWLRENFMPEARLDQDNLDAIEAARPNMRLSGLIDFQINSRALLQSIAEQTNMLYFESARGRAKFVPNTLNDTAIQDLTEADTIRGSVVYQRVRATDNMYTDFRIFYDRDPSLGNGEEAYSGFVFATPDGSNHTDADLTPFCRAALGIAGNRRVKTILGFLIADRETAETVLEEQVALHTARTYDAFFETPLGTVHLEQGDVITLSDRSLPDVLNGATYRILDRTIRPQNLARGMRFRARLMTAVFLGSNRTLLWREGWNPSVFGRIPLWSEQWEPSVFSKVLPAVWTEPWEPSAYNRVSNWAEGWEPTVYNSVLLYSEGWDA